MNVPVQALISDVSMAVNRMAIMPHAMKSGYLFEQSYIAARHEHTHAPHIALYCSSVMAWNVSTLLIPFSVSESWGSRSGKCQDHCLLSLGINKLDAVLKNAIFWDIMPRGSCKYRCFRGKYRSINRVTKISELGTLAVTSNRSMLRRNTSISGC
jgi:hypothetical protein